MNEAIEDAFKLLAERPGCGTFVEIGHPRLTSIRFWPLKKYTDYLVIYRPLDEGIEVLRVIYGAVDMYRLHF